VFSAIREFAGKNKQYISENGSQLDELLSLRHWLPTLYSHQHFAMKLRLTFVASLICFSALSQQVNVDSLQTIVNRNQGDANTFFALEKLAQFYEKENPETAIKLYRQAMKFPFRSLYSKNFVAACNSLAGLYQNRAYYDSSLLLHQQALDLALKVDLQKEVGRAYQGMALNFLRLSKYDTAGSYLIKALDVFEKLKEPSLIAGVHVNLGNIMLEERNYPESLNEFIKAADIYEGPARDSTGLARAWLNIANIENILEQYDKALDYLKRGLKIAEQKKNYPYLAYCHNLSGRIFRKLKKFQEAFQEYEHAIKIYHQRGDIRNEAETIFAEGNIYAELGQLEKGLTRYGTALELCKSIEAPSLLAYIYSAIGQNLFGQKKYNLAIAYLDSSMVEAVATKNTYLQMDAYGAKSEVYKAQKKFELALEFHEKYAALKDSIAADEKRQTTADLEAKYQNTKKNAEIVLLQKDHQLKDISLKQSRTLQSALLSAVILLMVIGVLVFNRNKMVNQAKRQMEIEKVRNQIARDLHDDMGSTLSSINLISQVALQENGVNQQTRYFQRIGEQSAKMMESMGDMVWSINPDNDTFQKTLAKMKEFSAEILEPKNISYQFQVDEGLNTVVLEVAKRKNLFLVFKEAINNAAKYSEGSFITISICQSADELILTIRDNGKGFDLSIPSSGNGLRNMRERANEINAQIKMDSSVGEGTLLVLNVPLT
jgi:signal transduction histidine kinase